MFSLPIEVKSIEEAPNYTTKDGWSVIKFTKAIVVERGTEEGSPTIDLQFEGPNGEKFIVMTTMGIIDSLAGVAKGVNQRTQEEDSDKKVQ